VNKAKAEKSAVHLPVDRVDGQLKVSGSAKYPSDISIENGVYATLLTSTVPCGRIRCIDTQRAENLAGVLGVITHKNALSIQPIPFVVSQPPGSEGHGLLPLQSDAIYYAGQPIGIVIADTLELVQYAATLIEVEYEAEAPSVVLAEVLDQHFTPADVPSFNIFAHTVRGCAQEAWEKATVRIDEMYTTPVMHHNPLLPFTTMATWNGEHLTVYETTQGISMTRDALAATFAMPQENVHVISSFIGGAFGCGLRLWPHTILACMAAREVGRPVKLVLTRKQMYTSVGYRPQTLQRLALGATHDGTLTSIIHDGTAQTSVIDEFVEPLTSSTRSLYACPNVSTDYRLVRLTLSTPTLMRAPGESTGMFALESAMDELSYALDMDPIALRLRNYADSDPETNKSWSSKALKECYMQGAKRIGWEHRSPTVRSMHSGNMLVGVGMASATYPYLQAPAQATIALGSDGSAIVQCGTTDIGTGTYTIMAQIASDMLGLPLARVRVELGDSNFPQAPPQGGSMTVASVGPAVREAAQSVRKQVFALACADVTSPLYGSCFDAVGAENGHLFLKDTPSGKESYRAILTRHNLEQIKAIATTQPQASDLFMSQSFGAHFAEVHVDTELGSVQVKRFVSAFGVGHVLNPKLARSQMIGGIAWGIGMALQEETLIDRRFGRIMNANLADYHIPVHADIITPEILFLEEDDPHINALGAKGLGEICLVGVAAAIANAIYHATGKRVRDLPITLDKLL
jgi:xanthine dehydrogenase YagR molybdenum-binding subunit